ncbi:MAG TPA: hypothetical protein ENI32_07970, partial [Candidatus Syntrophoarchaeum butanivorans]|nr:hypothetical protein [Candidatus Syntrophoarchaeum butanivorans]
MRRRGKIERYKLASVVILALLLVTTSFSCGCLKSDEGAWMKVTDDLGRNVTIPHKPERIVSLAPSVTEILFAIGAGDRVVGVDEISNYPPEVAEIEKVGSYARISTEKVVDLNPDLVVGAYGNGIETIEKISDLGIPVVGLNPRTLDEILDSINLLG